MSAFSSPALERLRARARGEAPPPLPEAAPAPAVGSTEGAPPPRAEAMRAPPARAPLPTPTPDPETPALPRPAVFDGLPRHADGVLNLEALKRLPGHCASCAHYTPDPTWGPYMGQCGHRLAGIASRPALAVNAGCACDIAGGTGYRPRGQRGGTA